MANRGKIAVLKNLYPAFTTGRGGVYGRQEIVVETPDHTRKLYDLPVADIAECLKVYADRVREIKKDKRIKYIEVFNNSGAWAGASKAHEHSQVIGMNFVSPYLLDKTEKEHRYQGKTGRCVYCDIIKKEEKGPRKIFSDKIFSFLRHMHRSTLMKRAFIRAATWTMSATSRPTSALRSLSRSRRSCPRSPSSRFRTISTCTSAPPTPTSIFISK